MFYAHLKTQVVEGHDEKLKMPQWPDYFNHVSLLNIWVHKNKSKRS